MKKHIKCNEHKHILAGKRSRSAKLLYIEGNELIEKWSKIVCVVVTIGTPFILILPKFVFSLFVYSAGTTTAADALLLPTPTW